jgi:hypothetical protein
MRAVVTLEQKALAKIVKASKKNRGKEQKRHHQKKTSTTTLR